MTDIVERLTYRAENLWSIVRPHAAILDLEAAAYIRQLESALDGLLSHYVALVDSGDCGFWDPETEEEVIAARKALRVFKLESERAEDHSTFT